MPHTETAADALNGRLYAARLTRCLTRTYAGWLTSTDNVLASQHRACTLPDRHLCSEMEQMVTTVRNHDTSREEDL